MEGSTGNAGAGTNLWNYKIGKILGIDLFGKVKIGKHVLTKQKVAIKIINRHKIKNTGLDEKEKGRLAEDEARRFFQQVVSGVEYCHRNMIIHLDLKPENLLLDSEYSIKITGFAFSSGLQHGYFLKPSYGSSNYAAPEVISGEAYAGPEVDIWGCGIILYALVCGSLPYDDEDIPSLFRKIKGGIHTLPSHLSSGVRDLISQMLVVDPMKRITMREIHRHPWFQALARGLELSLPDPV